MATKTTWCCWGGAKRGFPTFAVIIFVLAVVWILQDTGLLSVHIPWFPVILAIIAFGWIVDSYRKR